MSSVIQDKEKEKVPKGRCHKKNPEKVWSFAKPGYPPAPRMQVKIARVKSARRTSSYAWLYDLK